MKNNVGLTILLIISILYTISGQDLNQTNYRYAPMYLNPALSGNFAGTGRVGGGYRDQGRDLLFEGYSTGHVFADVPVSFALTGGDWAGIGIQAYSDQAGLLPLTTNGAILNLAYHLSLNNTQTSILSIGAQYGFIQRKLNQSEIMLKSDYVDPGVTLSVSDRFLNYISNYHDINAGIHFKTKFSQSGEFSIGASAYHLLGTNSKLLPDQNFYDRRLSVYTSVFFAAGKSLFFKPEIIVSKSEEALNIMPQFKTFIKLSNKKKNTDLIYAGFGYRVQDAVQFMFGFNFKKWDIGVAYDVTVSSAARYNNRKGGLEIGIFKIFEIPQKPKPDPILVCPRI